MSTNGRLPAVPAEPSREVAPIERATPASGTARGRPPQAASARGVPGVLDVLERRLQAHLVDHATAAEVRLHNNRQQLAWSEAATAEVESESRIRQAEVEAEERVRMEALETERALRQVVRLLPLEDAHEVVQRALQREKLLQEIGQARRQGRETAAQVQALNEQATLAAARLRAEGAQAALQVQRRSLAAPLRQGHKIAAAAVEREQQLLAWDRLRQQWQTSQDVPASEVSSPASAPLQPALSDQRVQALAFGYAALIRSLPLAEQERVLSLIEQQLTLLVPALVVEEVLERMHELLQLGEGPD